MPLAGRAAIINWSDVAVADRHTYYEWHNRENVLRTIGLPGAQRVRRFIAVEADRDFFTCCEVDDLGVITGPDYLAKVSSPSPLTRLATKVIRNAIRGLARVGLSVGPALGGVVLTLRLDAPAEAAEGLRGFLRDVLPKAVAMPGMVGAHWFESDMPASLYVSPERQGRPTAVPPWAIVIEGVSLDAVVAAGDALLGDDALLRHGAQGPVARGTYRNEITVAKLPNWQP